MQTEQKTTRAGISGAALKYLAMLLMVIDHIGAVIVMPCQLAHGGWPWDDPFYQALRTVGRMAFPLFCFLLVEGACHTHDRKKYLLRLLAFGLVSECVYDFANYQTWFAPEGQNVFFTLALGFAAIWCLEQGTATGKRVLGWCGVLACTGASCLLRTDYNVLGIGVILLFYLARKKRTVLYAALPVWLAASYWLSILWDCLYGGTPYTPLQQLLPYMLQEACGAFALVFIARYNGQRGGQMPKYFFYAFYPVHLLLLAAIRTLLLR